MLDAQSSSPQMVETQQPQQQSSASDNNNNSVAIPQMHTPSSPPNSSVAGTHGQQQRASYQGAAGSHSNSHNSSNHKGDQPNILFVGNLSFFCEECHLFDLFDEYAHVNGVRIVRNDNRTRSLMFGFVTLSTVHEAKEMERTLNGTFFMGRKLKCAISDRRNETQRLSANQQDNENGIQVHVAFSSFFTEDKIIRPTEAWLRKNFTKYGVLLDCCVKEYQHYKESGMQEGYGFIAFSSYEDAVKVTNLVQNINVQGITLTCSMSHLLHPGMPKRGGGSHGNMHAAGAGPMGHQQQGGNQGGGRGGGNNRPYHSNGPSSNNSHNNNNHHNSNGSPNMMEGGAPYHGHQPQMMFAPQGIPMAMQMVPMDGYGSPQPGYFASQSSASVTSGSTSGSGSMTMMPSGPPVTMSSPAPPMAMYPVPMYGVPVPYNAEPQGMNNNNAMDNKNHNNNNNNNNRKLSLNNYSNNSSYGNGGF